MSEAVNLTSASLSQTSKSALLNFSQGLAATQECNGAYQTSRRQDLEESPGRVVQEEDELHCNYAAKEQGVRDGCSIHGFREVVEIGAQEQPSTNKGG